MSRWKFKAPSAGALKTASAERSSDTDSFNAKDIQIILMQSSARYLIVDGHSIIFAWPELRKLHARRSSLGREALLKQLRDYQDWTGVHVVVVFDGTGKKVEATSEPPNVKIFNSCRGQTPDAIIDRLWTKNGKRKRLMLAPSVSMELKPVQSSGP